VAWLSDFNLTGSGYLNISVPLCSGLVEKGHDVRAVGLGYLGNEHNYNFGVIPAANMKEALAVLQNLSLLWHFDILIVALDITLQEVVLRSISNRTFGYIGVMPIEADPLCMSWAMVLMQMDKVFIISQFGTDEAKKMNIEAEHLQIGIDTELWRMPLAEEKQTLRKSYGIDPDAFVVLTVADNQERKNLSAAMKIFAGFTKKVPNSKYILVTRENAFVGWKLRDLAQLLKINDKFNIYERGISFQELWNLYAISDAFLLTSKSEGLGMPLLEAMSVGLPCIANNCTGMGELLADGRGILVNPEYSYTDPFGNGNRYFIDVKKGIRELVCLANFNFITIRSKAREYVEGRKWEISIEQMERAVIAARREPSEPQASKI
jgi:glycosyltransferase involved in cell wall biosynthesis